MYTNVPQSYDDIEIRIHSNARLSDTRLSDGEADQAINQAGYYVVLRHSEGEAKSDRGPLPYEEFERLADNACDYGTRLFEWLFEGEVGEAFRQARWVTESVSFSVQSAQGGLRVRLWLDDKARQLQTLRWEALFDPNRAEPLSLDIAFSRLVRMRAPRSQEIYERPLRVLLVAANVEGLPEFDLSPVDAVLNRIASSSEGGSLRSLLALEKLIGRPSLARLQQELSKSYHIIQLWVHATSANGAGQLIFSDEAGKPQYVSFDTAIEAIKEHPPQLVFLITDSARDEKNAIIQEGLAPRLLEIGVQAVVAVQAQMETTMSLLFIERFYTILFRTGLIDVAVAEARHKIYQPARWDWARPTLYVRTYEAKLFQPLPEFLESIVQSQAIKEVFDGTYQ